MPENDLREIASAGDSQHRASESNSKRSQKESAKEQPPISIHESGTALAEISKSPVETPTVEAEVARP